MLLHGTLKWANTRKYEIAKIMLYDNPQDNKAQDQLNDITPLRCR